MLGFSERCYLSHYAILHTTAFGPAAVVVEPWVGQK